VIFDVLVLGPVELRVDGRRELSGSAKAAHALAALALDAGKAVSLDNLATRLWDYAPLAKAHASLHALATRIRRKVGAEQLNYQAHSYTLTIDPEAVDYHRFERLVTQARSLDTSGNALEALRLLQQAETLWRGEPLTGLTGLWAEEVRDHLSDRHLRPHPRLVRGAAVT
jgi:DNA-binding SARP family transcriptional activator